MKREPDCVFPPRHVGICLTPRNAKAVAARMSALTSEEAVGIIATTRPDLLDDAIAFESMAVRLKRT